MRDGWEMENMKYNTILFTDEYIIAYVGEYVLIIGWHPSFQLVDCIYDGKWTLSEKPSFEWWGDADWCARKVLENKQWK